MQQISGPHHEDWTQRRLNTRFNYTKVLIKCKELNIYIHPASESFDSETFVVNWIAAVPTLGSVFIKQKLAIVFEINQLVNKTISLYAAQHMQDGI